MHVLGFQRAALYYNQLIVFLSNKAKISRYDYELVPHNNYLKLFDDVNLYISLCH